MSETRYVETARLRLCHSQQRSMAEILGAFSVLKIPAGDP